MLAASGPAALAATTPVSQLRIQFTTGERYQPFLSPSAEAEVLGVRARIAGLKERKILEVVRLASPSISSSDRSRLVATLYVLK